MLGLNGISFKILPPRRTATGDQFARSIVMVALRAEFVRSAPPGRRHWSDRRPYNNRIARRVSPTATLRHLPSPRCCPVTRIIQEVGRLAVTVSVTPPVK